MSHWLAFGATRVELSLFRIRSSVSGRSKRSYSRPGPRHRTNYTETDKQPCGCCCNTTLANKTSGIPLFGIGYSSIKVIMLRVVAVGTVKRERNVYLLPGDPVTQIIFRSFTRLDIALAIPRRHFPCRVWAPVPTARAVAIQFCKHSLVDSTATLQKGKQAIDSQT